ncbi:elongation factor P-like protein YeiP [Ignatzschineria cameli]|uniref:Elongation factor P-like protein YeiP n=1 Tax=Ignatzschineria cameli TaxID=2182793 RepID=A0A2U2APP9_9GAMM|nr:elongation factor P-like protein YeiP [Ignatzschineria cameli]PWD83378.1 elongation factor P-like protein YeiP [Ignatzschineria cameli]PWD85496.1 elongation factor P-like protein YeiP [Ignatzschineria cameli]PWD89190.1 elongation factor P-like protein YeiP [Ignatzschineria cameli]PWD90636.1 elongation factor P-like protein YeiP [Ignatzschineria cameli]PWD91340.1 elongation factor P-like protein YeiP [Ignatzschineria cameli]
MKKANEIRRGDVVQYNNLYYLVREVEKSAPTARGGNTTFRIQMFSIPDNHKIDLSLRADDELDDVELTKREASYSYKEGDNYVFMDSEDYSQYYLSEKLVGDDAGFILEGIEGYYVSLVNEVPVALSLPQTVVLEVIDTAPELKGASATKRNKPAKLSTGITVSVPEYIENGTKIVVNTDTREYSSRAN